jgi:hypothetical protein
MKTMSMPAKTAPTLRMMPIGRAGSAGGIVGSGIRRNIPKGESERKGLIIGGRRVEEIRRRAQ